MTIEVKTPQQSKPSKTELYVVKISRGRTIKEEEVQILSREEILKLDTSTITGMWELGRPVKFKIDIKPV